MHVVTAKASHSPAIHDTLDEVISLHSILVAGAVGKMREACFAQFVIFEPPEIPQVKALMKTDGPVVISPLDRIL